MELVSDKEPEKLNNQVKHAYNLNLINEVVNKTKWIIPLHNFSKQKFKKKFPKCATNYVILFEIYDGFIDEKSFKLQGVS